MAPENVQVVYLKLQMQPDVDFQEASKGQPISRDPPKISEFTRQSKKSLSTSPWITKSRLLKQEDSSCFNC